MKPKHVTLKFMLKLIDNETMWRNPRFRNLYYCEDENGFSAIDNTSRECFTEWFPTKRKALNWLNKYQ